MKTKVIRRAWRKKRIQKKIRGDESRPRLSVFRSATHIYAQVIDDVEHKTLAATSSLCSEITKSEGGNKSAVAKEVGKLIALKCKEKNINKVVFDRNGFVYHGRIKSLAEGAREGGLEF